MLSQSKIFLIGMPGSGKSSVGRILATKLEMLFIDLDDEIETDYGKTISQIFNNKGKDFFRKLESEIFRDLNLNKTSFVMATGGGTPCFYDGIKQMNSVGKTIFLETSLDNLLLRVSRTSIRPILGNNYQKALKELLVNRRECYQQANLILNTDNLGVKEIADKISPLIN